MTRKYRYTKPAEPDHAKLVIREVVYGPTSYVGGVTETLVIKENSLEDLKKLFLELRGSANKARLRRNNYLNYEIEISACHYEDDDNSLKINLMAYRAETDAEQKSRIKAQQSAAQKWQDNEKLCDEQDAKDKEAAAKSEYNQYVKLKKKFETAD